MPETKQENTSRSNNIANESRGSVVSPLSLSPLTSFPPTNAFPGEVDHTMGSVITESSSSATIDDEDDDDHHSNESVVDSVNEKEATNNAKSIHGKETYDASNNANTENPSNLNLNPYSIYPTTVPPYVLDEVYMDLNRTKKSDLSMYTSIYTAPPHENNDYSYDALEKDLRWVRFVNLVGTNVNYLPNQRVDIFEKKRNDERGHIKENYSFNTGSNRNSIVSSLNTIDELYDDAEKERIRNEILYDLDSSWRGDLRLKNVYGSMKPAYIDYSDKDEVTKWNEHFPVVLNDIYRDGYANNKKSNDEDEEEMHNKYERNWDKVYKKKFQIYRPKILHFVDNSRYLPLAFRAIIGIFSLVSLGLAVRVFQNSKSFILNSERSIPQQASTIMAICVNSIAVVYTIYIAIDEFNGKPLGLRNPEDKIKIVSLDILFIIFSSANLALAFNTRYDKQWVCSSFYSLDIVSENIGIYPKAPYICKKQKALASFLFILLFTWFLSVICSVFKIVRRTTSSTR